jgi:hypothetical protein
VQCARPNGIQPRDDNPCETCTKEGRECILGNRGQHIVFPDRGPQEEPDQPQQPTPIAENPGDVHDHQVEIAELVEVGRLSDDEGETLEGLLEMGLRPT